MVFEKGKQMNSDDYTYDLNMSTITLGPTGSTGPVYTISSGLPGTGSIDWGNITVSSGYDYSKTLEVKGDANFDGDIKVKGKSLVEAIENIEKRLAILHPNPELEEKWEKLKALGDMYRELEAEILEKEKVWKILQK